MNWTGGRLSRSRGSRNAPGSLNDRQKQHFAKVHNGQLNGLIKRNPTKWTSGAGCRKPTPSPPGKDRMLELDHANWSPTMLRINRYSKPTFPTPSRQTPFARHRHDQLEDGLHFAHLESSSTKRKRKNTSPLVYTTLSRTTDSSRRPDHNYTTKSLIRRRHHEIGSGFSPLSERGSRQPLRTRVEVPSGERGAGQLDKDRRQRLLRMWDWTGTDVLQPMKLQRSLAADNEMLGKRRRISDDTGKTCTVPKSSLGPKRPIVRRRHLESSSSASLLEELGHDEDFELAVYKNVMGQSPMALGLQHAEALKDRRILLPFGSTIDEFDADERLNGPLHIWHQSIPSVRTCTAPLKHPAPRSSQSEKMIIKLLRSNSSLEVPLSGSSNRHAVETPQKRVIDYRQAFSIKPRNPGLVAKARNPEDAWKQFVFSDVEDE